jgi:O-antigen ligase
MKWIVLALFLMTVPLLAAWLRSNPRKAYYIWGLLGFLPFVLGPWHLQIAPFATPMWSGYVKGWEISLLDVVALAVILAGRGERWPRLALILPLAMYVIAVVFAVTQAKFGTLAMSYVIQLLRVVLVYLAVARVVVSDRGTQAVLTGLIMGLALQAGYALWARMGGALQTGGTLGHQNLLGFVSHMVMMPAFAMVLAGRWQRTGLFGVFAGAIVVILTASRATIVFSGIGLALTLLVSLVIRMSGRKALVGLVGVLFLAISFPIANLSLERRFEAQKGASFFKEDTEREAFKKAAFAMLAAKPLGVGPNHYVFIANTEGYSARAGVHWGTGSRSASVHNSYLLVATETGYFGLFAFIILLLSAIWTAIASAVRYRSQNGSEIFVGLGCGLVVMAIHALYEYMFVAYSAQYIFAILLGLIAGRRSYFESYKKNRLMNQS